MEVVTDKSKPTERQQVAVKSVPPRKGWFRRWIDRFLALLVLIGILGWFAPTIVATTELRNDVARFLFPNLPGEIRLGPSSFGWTSPVVIRNLSVRDEEGHPLCEVDRVSTSETLWSLVSKPQKLGTLLLVEPRLHLSIDESGSNLERFLEKFLAGSSGKPSPDVVVEIAQGAIDLENTATIRQSTIEGISLRLTSTAGVVNEIDLAIGETSLTNEEAEATDWMAVWYSNNVDGATDPNGTKRIKIRASNWNLNRLAPLLSRLEKNGVVAGELSADASVNLSRTTDVLDWEWSGTAEVAKLSLVGIDALNRDKLELAKVSLSGQCASANRRLAMHDFKFSTDVGEVTATGDIPLDSSGSMAEAAGSLFSNEDYHISGNVDLMKLATLLPQTLRVRDGVVVTGGNARIDLVGMTTDGIRRWSGSAEVDGLTATSNGRILSWDKPVATRLNAHRDGTSVVVDLMECKSDFLELSGNGTLADARFNASGDLSKLLENLERFVDLGVDHLAGRAKAVGELRRRDDGMVTLTSDFVLDDFAYAVSNKSVWQEKHLTVSVKAEAQVDASVMLTSINSGTVRLLSQNDLLEASLQKPVDLGSKSADLAVTASLKGSLASWQNRLRPFVAVDGWRLAGNVDLAATATAKAQSVDVSRFVLNSRGFEAAGPQWLIREPELKLETTGRWDGLARQWTSPKTSLVAKSISADVTGLECVLGPQGVSGIIGTAAYRADLTQVSNWKNQAIPNPSYYLIGSLSGTAGIKRQGSSLSGNVDARVEKLVVAGRANATGAQPQWEALWKEPSVKISGKGGYDGTSDQLTVESGFVELDGLAVATNGRLAGCSSKQDITLTGQLSYDWDALTKRFGPRLQQEIQLSGKDQRPFSIKGSLASLGSAVGSNAALSDLSGQAGLGWTSANLYGIPVSAGYVSAELDHRVCRFAPLEMTVNDGRLHVTPTIQLDRQPYTLVLGKEKLLDGVSLTPQFCAGTLKYVAPALADSTEVQGKLSVEMIEASLPLASASDGTADGVLTIHQAEAKPGSVVLQIAEAIDQVQAVLKHRSTAVPADRLKLEMPAQQVPFKLQQRRVYHQGMTFVVDNVQVKTSGSVGMDSTLSLIAEIPFRDEWLGGNKTLAGLKGKTIQIPITGTTSRPRMDPSIMANLAQQIGGSAVEGLLNDKIGGGLNEAINNGLDRLFKGRR